MNDPQQALAYAQADFAEAHNRFVELFKEKFPRERIEGYVLDLGCGPADVTIRFARAYPNCLIHGIDGAQNMLRHGRDAIAHKGLESRIRLYWGRLPQIRPLQSSYHVIISNSLLEQATLENLSTEIVSDRHFIVYGSL